MALQRVCERNVLQTSLQVGMPTGWQPGDKFYHCSDIDYGAVAEVARSYGHKRAVMARPPEEELDPIRLGVAARPRAAVGMGPGSVTRELAASIDASDGSPTDSPGPLPAGPDPRQAQPGKRLSEFPLELQKACLVGEEAVLEAVLEAAGAGAAARLGEVGSSDASAGPADGHGAGGGVAAGEGRGRSEAAVTIPSSNAGGGAGSGAGEAFSAAPMEEWRRIRLPLGAATRPHRARLLARLASMGALPSPPGTASRRFEAGWLLEPGHSSHGISARARTAALEAPGAWMGYDDDDFGGEPVDRRSPSKGRAAASSSSSSMTSQGTTTPRALTPRQARSKKAAADAAAQGRLGAERKELAVATRRFESECKAAALAEVEACGDGAGDGAGAGAAGDGQAGRAVDGVEGEHEDEEGPVAGALRQLRAGASDEDRCSLWLDALGVRLEWALAGAAASAAAEAAGVPVPDEAVPEEMEAGDVTSAEARAASLAEDEAWRTAARRAYLALLREARVPLRASKTGIQLSYRLLPRTTRGDDDVPVEVARAAEETEAADARLFKGSGVRAPVSALGLLKGDAAAALPKQAAEGEEVEDDDDEEEEEEEERKEREGVSDDGALGGDGQLAIDAEELGAFDNDEEDEEEDGYLEDEGTSAGALAGAAAADPFAEQDRREAEGRAAAAAAAAARASRARTFGKACSQGLKVHVGVVRSAVKEAGGSGKGPSGQESAVLATKAALALAVTPRGIVRVLDGAAVATAGAGAATAGAPPPAVAPAQPLPPGIRLLTDVAAALEGERACDSAHYFPFVDAVSRLSVAFHRDASLPLSCTARPTGCPARLTAGPDGPWPVPTASPSGVVPCGPTGQLLAPLVLVCSREETSWALHRALFQRFWCRLQAVSSAPDTLLPLLAEAEAVLALCDPELGAHLASIGADPIRCLIPMLRGALSNVLAPRQVLALWDRVIALNSLQPLVLAAAGTLLARRRELMQCKVAGDVGLAFVKGTDPRLSAEGLLREVASALAALAGTRP